MANLEITVKVTETKGLRIGKAISFFGKPRVPVGFWNNNSIVFATAKPKTMPEAEALIYTIEELREFWDEGNLQGLIEL